MSRGAKKRMIRPLSKEPTTQKPADATPELHFSKKDIEGCFETEVAYVVVITTPTGSRYERLYAAMAENDKTMLERFEHWLNKPENSVYKNEEFRGCVMLHKQIRILISTRMA